MESPVPDPPGEKIDFLAACKYMEAGGGTEEPEFDWIVAPPPETEQESFLPRPGEMTAKNVHRENGARTTSVHWIMKMFPATSSSGLKDLIKAFITEMNPDCHQVRIMTKYVQVGSNTEEPAFDWVVVPFTDQEHRSSLPGSGKMPVKETDAENGD
ncbi:hypothetical protein [Akkermansia massiliensis]